MNKFGRSLSLLSLALVVLLAGCSLGGNVFKYEIAVDPAAAAEVHPPSGKAKVDETVTITLTPKEGYEFVKWDGDVEPQKGDAEGKWMFVMPKKDVKLTAVFREEEVEVPEPEPVDEEALVQAVRDARDKGALEDFMDALEALQDAGLLTDVVEEHGPAYLEKARDLRKFPKFFALSTAPYMRDAADIQELIIDPVNEWVAEAIGAINGARTPAETKKAWKRFKGHGKSLLDFEGFELTGVEDDVVEELLFKYQPLSVADIRDIVYGAYVKGQVDDLFQGRTVAEDVDQEQIDKVAELVTEVAIDELKAELEAAVVKAQGLWDEKTWKKITEGVEKLFSDGFNWETFEPGDELELKSYEDEYVVGAIKDVEELLEDYRGTEDVELVAELLETAREMWIVKRINEWETGKNLASWIVNYMTITQFNELSAAQRDEVAGFLLKSLDPGEEPYFKSSEEFIEAVVAEVGKYLELLGAVNAAATDSQMVVALEGLKYYKKYGYADSGSDYGVFAIYVAIGIGGDYDTQLRIAEGMLGEVPFETIWGIADELQNLIE